VDGFFVYRCLCTAGEWNWFVYFCDYILFCCSFRRTGVDPGLHFWEIVIFFLQKASRHRGIKQEKKRRKKEESYPQITQIERRLFKRILRGREESYPMTCADYGRLF